MREKIYSREFRASVIYAFPKTGSALQIALSNSTCDYLCELCGRAESSFHIITMDVAGYPTSSNVRRLVYYHFMHHEKPRLTFERMTDRGRRVWYARKLGYKVPPRSKSAEDLRALAKLVTNGRNGR